jgi:hypothetical protein
MYHKNIRILSLELELVEILIPLVDLAPIMKFYILNLLDLNSILEVRSIKFFCNSLTLDLLVLL